MAHYETHENHKNYDLRTHWYSCSYQELKDAINKFASEFGYEILDINDHYREFLLEGPSTLVIAVSQYHSREYGVDFSINTKYTFDFGQGKRMIKKIYESLAQKVTMKGIGIHP